MGEQKKKKLEFTIVKNDPMDGHGGFGKGAINLNNVSPVIIDVEKEEAFVDMGAMHARSAVEKGLNSFQIKKKCQMGNFIGLYG